MAIIVDKAKKREDIASSCIKIFTEIGVDDLTISKVAQTAGIGKGTVYEYFRDKEDIVFEMVNILMKKHNDKKEKRLKEFRSPREKLKYFFSFFYNEEDKELRGIYKEFISIILKKPNPQMIEFQDKCFKLYLEWTNNIIDDAIQNKEVTDNAKEFTTGLFAFMQGIFIMNETTNSIQNLKYEINHHIDMVFDTIEVKK
jgi:AcrR family transcriptional regulator